MSKEKVIDVWIHDGFDETMGWRAMQVTQQPCFDVFNTKAKLIIEIPEKKIELTESQIRDAIRNHLSISERSMDANEFLSKLGF